MWHDLAVMMEAPYLLLSCSESLAPSVLVLKTSVYIFMRDLGKKFDLPFWELFRRPRSVLTFFSAFPHGKRTFLFSEHHHQAKSA